MLASPIVQIAYFVSDVRESAVKMASTLGAGPFFLAEGIELAWDGSEVLRPIESALPGS
jgi:hypothetical protein